MEPDIETLTRLLAPHSSATPFGIMSLLLNLAAAAILGLLMQRWYVRFGRVVTNRQAFSMNFVPVMLAVTLIISIISTSIALSLGLVGALSMVRFRTPIREPEELIWLFLAIAFGLGLGAGMILQVFVAFFFIFTILRLLNSPKALVQSCQFFLEIEVAGPSVPPLPTLDALLKGLQVQSYLRRCDSREDGTVLCYALETKDRSTIQPLCETLRQQFPTARIMVLEQQGLGPT